MYKKLHQPPSLELKTLLLLRRYSAYLNILKTRKSWNRLPLKARRARKNRLQAVALRRQVPPSCKLMLIPALQGARDLYNKLGLRHPHAGNKQEIQKHEYLKTGLRSLISLRIVESLTHISLINLLPLVIRRLFALCHQVRNGMS